MAALQAKHAFVSTYWAYRSYQASRLPSLNLYGNLMNFDRSLTLLQSYEDGTFRYANSYNLQNSLGLSVAQNVTFTGGRLSVYSDLRRIDQYGAFKNLTWYSQPITVSYTQPLFAYNQFKWDKLIEPKEYEIGRGTSTYDGMSIARAIVEYIHEYGHGAKTLFATHYHELNDLEEIYPRVRNFHIAVKEVGTKVIFLRKLKEGGTAHSFGIHVARMAGMPKEVVQSAENTLKALEMNDSQHLVSSKKGQIKKPVQTKAGTIESDGSLQLSFFQLDDPTLASLRDQLKGADLNNMTPLQAFDLLRSMKSELGL